MVMDPGPMLGWCGTIVGQAPNGKRPEIAWDNYHSKTSQPPPGYVLRPGNFVLVPTFEQYVPGEPITIANEGKDTWREGLVIDGRVTYSRYGAVLLGAAALALP